MTCFSWRCQVTRRTSSSWLVVSRFRVGSFDIQPPFQNPTALRRVQGVFGHLQKAMVCSSSFDLLRLGSPRLEHALKAERRNSSNQKHLKRLVRSAEVSAMVCCTWHLWTIYIYISISNLKYCSVEPHNTWCLVQRIPNDTAGRYDKVGPLRGWI